MVFLGFRFFVSIVGIEFLVGWVEAAVPCCLWVSRYRVRCTKLPIRSIVGPFGGLPCRIHMSLQWSLWVLRTLVDMLSMPRLSLGAKLEVVL